ncbi:hypothetical protein OKA05_06605 [Luteolibacter arcticus]|uniref:Uncharacterized protein n=1 Tax=Luteolibacter arcticus TaxID=1581411 RepID=A0ABT3GF24_9BACT|nr:hypothetical protein [Luteolibacter arcticus]MCW1922216.1 hypothetical protein [Luteolibacter arcticus]
MCCFSGNVTFVRGTRIFSRITEGGRQAVVYQMEFGAKQELAMILPLPVAKGADEKAVKFIDLSGYKDLFRDLRSGFPFPRAVSRGRDEPLAAAAGGLLEVKQVGAYEASFVPTVKDFTRLDPRFRLPAETWQALPAYADHGFAVFKLRAGEQEVHPMAFTFPTRHPETLFFPTVHIHDGKVHPEEDFDHDLYCQVARTGLFAMTRWQESERLASAFTKPENAEQLIVGDAHVYRRSLVGKMKNEDIILATA